MGMELPVLQEEHIPAQGMAGDGYHQDNTGVVGERDSAQGMEGDEQHQGNTEVEGAHIPAPWMDDQETTTVAREESRPEDGT